ncbi:hypothetical protein Tco_0258228, partial [Tanacetum coccineum]
EAIRQAYLVETETPESPHTVASPTPLPDITPPTRHADDSVDSDTSDTRSTPTDSTARLSPDHPLTHASPNLVPILHRTARMVMRFSPAMSLGLSASIAEVTTISDSAFSKMFKSSYESSPSSSPPDLPSQKRYQDTSELLEDEEEEKNNKEEDGEEEDEEVDDSLDYDSESEDAEDKGPTTEDEDPAPGEKGFLQETRALV